MASPSPKSFRDRVGTAMRRASSFTIPKPPSRSNSTVRSSSEDTPTPPVTTPLASPPINVHAPHVPSPIAESGQTPNVMSPPMQLPDPVVAKAPEVPTAPATPEPVVAPLPAPVEPAPVPNPEPPKEEAIVGSSEGVQLTAEPEEFEAEEPSAPAAPPSIPDEEPTPQPEPVPAQPESLPVPPSARADAEDGSQADDGFVAKPDPNFHYDLPVVDWAHAPEYDSQASERASVVHEEPAPITAPPMPQPQVSMPEPEHFAPQVVPPPASDAPAVPAPSMPEPEHQSFPWSSETTPRQEKDYVEATTGRPPAPFAETSSPPLSNKPSKASITGRGRSGSIAASSSYSRGGARGGVSNKSSRASLVAVAAASAVPFVLHEGSGNGNAYQDVSRAPPMP
ncbi:hypothetical protein JAAARDRAFT_213705 [Jaapia argillacea MUCL 33604]|uniref:Uncharacterized protein n=1 Tax=Jaapia argillacea MUCL 33604 TaxID=933084 RepID=A0A067QKD6_9AGAM|nr:hypothetical protein JAAARDRAFT_213705 [Jaapia argillacea MUCL 33604]